MAQPLKAPHLAGTETSLPGHRFPALSPRAARRAHAELRSPPPRVWLKARHPQPRGKANVCAAPRSPTAPPRGTARDGAEALTQPPPGWKGGCGHGGAERCRYLLPPGGPGRPRDRRLPRPPARLCGNGAKQRPLPPALLREGPRR